MPKKKKVPRRRRGGISRGSRASIRLTAELLGFPKKKSRKGTDN